VLAVLARLIARSVLIDPDDAMRERGGGDE
jgi:hypothetical protein